MQDPARRRRTRGSASADPPRPTQYSMSEPKRPTRRGRRPRTRDAQGSEIGGEPNPYRDAPDEGPVAAAEAPTPRPKRPPRRRRADSPDAAESGPVSAGPTAAPSEARPAPAAPAPPPAQEAPSNIGAPSGPPPREHHHREGRGGPPAGAGDEFRGGRRGARRGRGRFRKDRRNRGGEREPHSGREGREPREPREYTAPAPAEGTMTWAGSMRARRRLPAPRRAQLSPGTDRSVRAPRARAAAQVAARRQDRSDIRGRDHRGRSVVLEIQQLNDGSPVVLKSAPTSTRSWRAIPSGSSRSRPAGRRRRAPSSRGAPSTSSRRSATASARSSSRRPAPARRPCCRRSWKASRSTIPGGSLRAPRGRAPRRSERDDHVGLRRGGRVELRHARRSGTPKWRR
jgi:transcription termination factor Rho